MNYLAHLFLAEDSVDSIIGNFIADSVKGPLNKKYSAEINKGIATHRKVDSFTDSHERVLLSKKLISPSRRRFAGVILDVSYDHFLAKNWEDYSCIKLPVFIQKIYTVLAKHKQVLPEKLHAGISIMIDEDRLGSYQQIKGVDYALNRISQRVKRKNNLMGSVEELESNYEILEEHFKVFFPELIANVEDYRKNY